MDNSAIAYPCVVVVSAFTLIYISPGEAHKRRRPKQKKQALAHGPPLTTAEAAFPLDNAAPRRAVRDWCARPRSARASQELSPDLSVEPALTCRRGDCSRLAESPVRQLSAPRKEAPTTPDHPRMSLFVFPRWANKTRVLAGAALGVAALPHRTRLVRGLPKDDRALATSRFSPSLAAHALRWAARDGLRHASNTVEKAGFAAIPDTDTCMNCHSKVRTTSPALQPLRDAQASNKPVEWVKVHDLPDYVYFNHGAHVARGVGCVSCHGRVDQMPEVFQKETRQHGAGCLGSCPATRTRTFGRRPVMPDHESGSCRKAEESPRIPARAPVKPTGLSTPPTLIARHVIPPKEASRRAGAQHSRRRNVENPAEFAEGGEFSGAS